MGQPTRKQKDYAEKISRVLKKDLPQDITFESLKAYISENVNNYYASQKRIDEDRNREIREKIVSEIKITDYAANELEFTLVRKGRYYSLEEHDSVMIDVDRNCYWRNSKPGQRGIGEGGSVIDFALEFSGMSKAEIMREFSNRVEGIAYNPDMHRQARNQEPVKEKGELALPEKAGHMRNVFAYLTKSRYIDPDVVQEMVDRKMLYQSKDKNNCVFVAYDDSGKAVFASLRGTNTFRRFAGDVKNCNYDEGFYISNGADKLILPESVIDAYSIMSILKAQGIDYHAYDYMPLNGATKTDAVMYHLERNPKKEVLIATDNDAAGYVSLKTIHDEISRKQLPISVSAHIPEQKDWNAALEAASKKLQVKEVDFLQADGKDSRMKEALVKAEVYMIEHDMESCQNRWEKQFSNLPKLGKLSDEDWERAADIINQEEGLDAKGKVRKITEYEQLQLKYQKLTDEKREKIERKDGHREVSPMKKAMDRRAQQARPAAKPPAKGIDM